MIVINMKHKKISTEQFLEMMINKELEIVNAPIRYSDLIGEKKHYYTHWYTDFAFDTIDQYKEWENYYYEHFYDHYPKRIKDIHRHFSWFNLQYGLRYGFPYDDLKKYEINK